MRSLLATARVRPVPRLWPARLFCWLGCLLLLLPVAGCGGCGRDERTEAEKEAERRAKEEEARKPDFELQRLVAEPFDESSKSASSVLCWYKPGHWTNTLLSAKANKEDFLGELTVAATRRSGSAGQDREMIPLPGVAYTMIQSREVALPKKGKPKNLVGYLLVPPTQEQASVQVTLAGRGGGRTRAEMPTQLTRMPAHQYHLVVLARSPSQYQNLKLLDSIQPPYDPLANRLEEIHYQVSLLKASSRMPLPADALYWTSIAYVLWDGVDPQSLSTEQRQAMLDWLYWGGQIILSGPDTLDTLRGSFLEEHLPAKSEGVWHLAASDFDELNRNLVVPREPKLVPTGAWTGVKLALAPGAQFVPGCGKLLAERRVGRGRIVVCALRLSDRSLIGWAGFDAWFNACLLRRPARTYGESEHGDLELHWTDPQLDRYDAALTTGLRYFSRDAHLKQSQYTDGFLRDEPPIAAPGTMMGMGLGGEPDLSEERTTHAGAGMAAWCDFGPVPQAAREALANAASVEVPDRWFVVWVVAAYLVVLVPLNWFIFTVLGRVEWAWVAAPLIAIAYTVLVIRLAQLDIGFARSETNVGVIELQADCDRAHLTRYTALYTSLTTYYEVEHEDPGSLALPFSELESPLSFDLLAGGQYRTLRYEHGRESQLTGLLVASNSTDSVHTEEMLTLEGRLSLARDARGRWQLSNQTGLPLFGVGLLRRSDAGRLETCWVGTLAELGSAPVEFLPATVEANPRAADTWWPTQRDQDAATSAQRIKGQCNVRELIKLAEDPDLWRDAFGRGLRPGECRLVAWTNKNPSSVHVRPAAPQSQAALVVVAHLRTALPEPPQRDANAKSQVGSRGRRLGPADLIDPVTSPQ